MFPLIFSPSLFTFLPCYVFPRCHGERSSLIVTSCLSTMSVLKSLFPPFIVSLSFSSLLPFIQSLSLFIIVSPCRTPPPQAFWENTSSHTVIDPPSTPSLRRSLTNQSRLIKVWHGDRGFNVIDWLSDFLSAGVCSNIRDALTI